MDRKTIKNLLYKTKSFHLSALLIVFLVSTNEVNCEALDLSQCDSSVRRTNGYVCYVAMDSPDPWGFAQLVCDARGMNLLEVLTDKENAAAVALLNSKNMVDSWLDVVQSTDTWRWLDDVELGDQGCFVDSQMSPDLEIFTEFPTDNSVSKCIEYCKNLSYAYAGVEAGIQCRCGNGFGKYGQEGAVCGNICPGNNDENCGGDTSQQIYAVYGVDTNWVAGQPNNNNGYQSCATVDSSSGLQWQDVYCRDTYEALCEIPVSGGKCPNTKAFLVNGRCIMTTDSPKNFFESRYACRSFGGDLVMHLTPADTAVIADRLNRSSTPTTGSQFYIGLTKWAWKWQTGSEFLYTNWRDGQPNGPNLNCASIKRDSDPGQWATIGCNTSHLYICQKTNATQKVTAPLFTLAPTTTPRRTAPPPLPTVPPKSSTGISLKPGSGSSLSPPNASNSTGGGDGGGVSGKVIGAIVGGVVGGLILLVILTIVIIIICLYACQRKSSQPQKPIITPHPMTASDPSPPPPSYFFGIETTPKYRTDKPVYPSLPDFKDDRTSTISSAADRYQPLSPKRKSRLDPVSPKYATLTALPIDDFTAYSHAQPTQYSSDIFINPELSY